MSENRKFLLTGLNTSGWGIGDHRITRVPVPAGMWTSRRSREAAMRDAITGIGLVAFGTIAVLALCIGVCALTEAVIGLVA